MPKPTFEVIVSFNQVPGMDTETANDYVSEILNKTLLKEYYEIVESNPE